MPFMPVTDRSTLTDLVDVEAFWQYSLQTYQPEAHARCFLWLQDNLDADVNLLLFLGYLKEIGQIISVEEWQYVLTYTKQLRDEVKAIRAQRRVAKNRETSEQYVQLKQVELAAEQRVQQVLIAAINRVANKPQSGSSHAVIGVRQYLQSLLADGQTLDDYQPFCADVIELLNPSR